MAIIPIRAEEYWEGKEYNRSRYTIQKKGVTTKERFSCSEDWSNKK